MNGPSMFPTPRPFPGDRPTAWVLSGGGSLGAVQVGMIRALLMHGLRPDALFGTSAGALNAAYLALDPTAERARDLAAIWTTLRRGDVFPIVRWRNVFGMFSQASLVDRRPLQQLIESRLGYAHLDETRVPVTIVATDADSGAEVRLSAGPVVPALLASTAIPGLLPPVDHEGRRLIDGSVVSNTPIAAAVEQGFEQIVVLPAAILRSPPAPRSAAALALHSLALMARSQHARDERLYGERARILSVPHLVTDAVAPHDFRKARQLMDVAMLHTHQWLASQRTRTPRPTAS